MLIVLRAVPASAPCPSAVGKELICPVRSRYDMRGVRRSVAYIFGCVVMRIFGASVRIVCDIRILLRIDINSFTKCMLGKVARTRRRTVAEA